MRKKMLFLKLSWASLFFFCINGYAQEGRLPVVADQVLANPNQVSRTLVRSEAKKVIQPASNREISPVAVISNQLVNNNAGASGIGRFTQSETSMVVFGNNVVIGYNDAGSTASGNHFTGWSYSSDGGATFTDGGTLPASAAGDAGDPVLARNNTTGRIYFATLGFVDPNQIPIFRSDDNGVTWMAPVNGTPGGDDEDKPWMTVDNFAGAGNGNVYVLSRRFAGPQGLYFFRSTDDGATYGPAGGTLIASGAAGNVQGAFLVVSPDHSISAFYFDDVANDIKLRRSTDLGLTWSAPVVVATGLAPGVNGNLGLTGIRQGTATPSDFRSSGFPHADVNPVSGHLYLTYASNPAGVDKADIYFVMSTNNGATWSAPVRVNDDITTTDQWMPTIAVTPDGLNVGVFYYSRQEDPANNLFKYYGRVASITGGFVTFGAGVPISDVASFPEFGRDNVVNAVYMGDYNQAVGTATGFSVVWSDNRDDLAGGAGRKDPNVYFASIPATGPPPIVSLAFVSSAISGGNGNGLIDINECNELSVTLINVGGLTATNITAVLTSTTPGVTIVQGTSSYPDLANGATGANTTPFKIATTSAYVCGSPINVKLTVSYDGGSQEFSFGLPTNETVGTAIQADNNTLTPITDLNTVNIPLTISGFSGVVGKVTASFYLTHTWDADLRISLVSPDGTVVELINSVGGSGDNFGISCSNRTILDDAAATSIIAGAPPFAGTFRPQAALAAFKGKSGSNVNGTWYLRITDVFNGDQGSVNCVSLFVSPSECTSLTPTAAVTVAPATQQYSDKVVFTATLNAFDCSATSLSGATVTFKVGTQEMLPAVPLVDMGNGVWIATATRSLLEVPTSPSNGQMAPGVHTVTAVFNSLPSGLSITDPTTNITINCEDASVTNNGQQYFNANPTTKEGTIELSAYVEDANDTPLQTRGDIRNATATFKDGASFATGTTLNTANVPVGLVNPGNIHEGFVSTSFDHTLTPGEISAGGIVYQVWTGLSNYYCGTTSTPTIITLGLPGQDFVTGGGNMIMQNSAGTYAGTAGEKMNFGFVMKFNPSGKNLQGNANIIFKKLEGTELSNFQIKSNSINSLVVQNVDDNGNPATGSAITFRKAIISTKANLKRIFADGTFDDLGGNYSLIITAWESATINDGSLDRISVQLSGNGSIGLLFSSSWSSGATIWQTLDGGKIQVRSQTTSPANVRLLAPSTDLAETLAIKAWPNPTERFFTLQVDGSEKSTVVIRVVDANGKQVYSTKGTGNRLYRFGDNFIAGIYLAEVTQNGKRSTVKLIKQ